MNKDINFTLNALIPVLRINGEKVKSIEAVRNWYKQGNNEYCKEVAEITYDNDYVVYADIGGDANLTAIYDIMAVIQELKSPSIKIERIERGIYPKPDESDMMIEEVLANLQDYSLWEYNDYKLSKSESGCVVEALKELKELRKNKSTMTFSQNGNANYQIGHVGTLNL